MSTAAPSTVWLTTRGQGVGRLGQSAMIYISWRVFADYVTACMETAPITYATFWIIFLEKEPSVFSIARLIRDFASPKRLRSMAAMIFILVTMAFVLAFPTLASSMTGYVVTTQAVVREPDGNLATFSNFNSVIYVIHDGWRINKTTDFILSPWGPVGSMAPYPFLKHSSNSSS